MLDSETHLVSMEIATGIAQVNGTKLYYEEAGSGFPVIFLHGWLLDTRMWDDQFEVFAQTFRTIRYDQRGFGKSQLPEASYKPIEDLAALMDFLGIEKACVVGHSNGGRVAIDFAVAYPQRTSALIVANPVLSGYVADNLSQSLLPIAERAQSHGGLAGNKLLMEHVIFETTRQYPFAMAKITQILTDENGWHWLNSDPEVADDPPAIQRLSEITLPTLVAFGERDMPDFPIIKDILMSHIPSAQLLSLPAAGHMCNMESPQDFNHGTIEFLQKALA